MPNVFLIDDFVLLASCPAGKDQEIYWDHPVGVDGRIRNDSVSGLGLRVTALGRKAFVHAYYFNGQRYRKVLGSTVLPKVASARLQVTKRKEQLDEGKDPDTDRIDTRRKHFLTVREVIDSYWEGHVAKLSNGYRDSFAIFVAAWKRRPPKTASRRGHNSRKKYSDFGTLFANKSFAAMKPMDIEQHQKQFTSPYSYNDGLARVSALFNWAIRMQLVDMRNPYTPLRMQKVIRRRRDYTTEQIRKIATHIFYPVMEVPPETNHLDGLDKRDMALVNGRVLAANERMLEGCIRG